ncbi:MAG: hypothetical protein AB8B71_08765 [Paracoccaceae bacterium]
MSKQIATTKRKPTPPADHPKLLLEFTEKGTVALDMIGDWNDIIEPARHISVTQGLMTQIANIGSRDQSLDVNASNFVVGYVEAMAPQDATEVLLFAQMATTHQTLMMLVRRMNLADTLQQAEAADRAYNKTARTFTTQMDALKRYRSKGKQIVQVERVTVENGGQAIVGTVEAGSRRHD